jgi:hypothetical protein
MSNWRFARQYPRILPPCLAGSLLFVLLGARAWDVLSVRTIFVLSTIALLFLAFPAAARLSSPHERTLATALFGGAVLLQALPELLHPQGTSLYEFGWRTSVVMSGWGFILSLIPLQREDTFVTPFVDRNRGRLLLLLAALLGALTGIHFAIRDRYAIVVDEVLYLLQGKLLLEPGYTRAIESSLAPFFVTSQSYVLNGRLNGQYPPGWPLFLALFDELGLRWFAPVGGGCSQLPSSTCWANGFDPPRSAFSPRRFSQRVTGSSSVHRPTTRIPSRWHSDWPPRGTWSWRKGRPPVADSGGGPGRGSSSGRRW